MIVRNDNVKPIKLASPDTAPTAGVYSITGWGKSIEPQVDTRLRKVEVPLVSYFACKPLYDGLSYPGWDLKVIVGNVCAGYVNAGGKDGMFTIASHIFFIQVDDSRRTH